MGRRVDEAVDDDEGNDAAMAMMGRAFQAANGAMLISNHVASSGSERSIG